MKRPLWQLSCAVLGLSVMLAGCGSDQNSSPPQGSYKEMKTMVVDILKSDEGKKAVEEALTGQSSSGGWRRRWRFRTKWRRIGWRVWNHRYENVNAHAIFRTNTYCC
ncbi:hypothetical protein ABIC22_002609 [Paenibacillus sp. PvP094]